MNFYAELMQSGPTALLVLALLLAFSVFSWAVIFVKARAFKNARETSSHFIDLFWRIKKLDEVYERSQRYQNSPAAQVFQKGYEELREGRQSGARQEDVLDGVEHALKRSISHETTQLERLVPFLATVGSTSPFIGLFGTVVGIMNSFRDIGASGNASLATVAPGIAEALVATAAGLLAAIPAVMAYNYFTVRIGRIRGEINNFAADFMRVARRDASS